MLKDFVAVVVLHVGRGDGVVLNTLDTIVLKYKAGPTAVVKACHAALRGGKRFF